MLKPEDLELHIGKFVKISVFHEGDLIVTSYGLLGYNGVYITDVCKTVSDLGLVRFEPIKSRILEGPEELHLIYEI